MSRAVRTRLEIEDEIKAARLAQIDVEDHTALCDHDSSLEIREARARVDAAIEAWAHVPAPRARS